MLVLSRKRDEVIVITDTETGERTSLMVVDIRGDKVRLGFQGSKRYTFHRKEVQDAIDRGEPARGTQDPAAGSAGGAT